MFNLFTVASAVSLPAVPFRRGVFSDGFSTWRLNTRPSVPVHNGGKRISPMMKRSLLDFRSENEFCGDPGIRLMCSGGVRRIPACARPPPACVVLMSNGPDLGSPAGWQLRAPRTGPERSRSEGVPGAGRPFHCPRRTCSF